MKSRLSSLWTLAIALAGTTLAVPAVAQLPHGYIVAIGKPIAAKLQDWSGVPGKNGQWPHYHITLDVNGEIWDSAIDLSTSSQTKQSRHRELLLPFGTTAFNSIFNKVDGSHVLPSNSAPGANRGGALDYIRHPGILQALDEHPWSNLDDRNSLIQPALHPTSKHKYDVPTYDDLFAQGVKRIYVFGEPYASGLGVHQVHQNQGDTNAAFTWQNGIWQDGGVILEMNSQTCIASICEPNRILLMARFADQLDFTWSEAAYGHAYSAPLTDVQSGQVVSAGSWRYFGPYTAEEMEVALSPSSALLGSTLVNSVSEATIVPKTEASKNLDLYINYGRMPSDAYANVHAWTNRLKFWERLYNTSGEPIYLAVRNNADMAVTFNLSVTYTLGAGTAYK